MNFGRAIALCALIAGCSRGSTRPAPQPLAVQPSAAYTPAEVPVVILGDHFEPRAVEQVGGGGGVQVDAVFRAFLGNVELQNVQWRSINQLTATVPSGLSGGPFDLRVVGPTGEGIASSAFVASTGRPAAICASLSAPARVELGTQANADLMLTNSGQAAVATPSIQLLADPGLAVVALPGAGVSIAPGQTVHLVALIAAQSRGPAVLTLHATGLDAFDGSTLDSLTSTTVQVVVPATLSVATAPLPDLVSVGQSLDVVATVTNQGDVDALGVALTPMTSGPGGAVVDALPLPQDIPAGASRTFHVAAHATSPGAIFFAGSATGSDALTSSSVSAPATWPVVFVQAAAQLSAGWLTVPPTIAPAQSFTATLVVTNSGQALAHNVSPVPNPPSVTAAAGSATLNASPAAAPVDVPGGSTVVFAWTFTAGGTPPDSVTLSAGASGTDANSGVVLSAGSVASPAIALRTASVLTASLSAPAATLRGDTFAVTLTVSDTGGVGVNALSPSLTISSGAGSAQILSGPTPASQNLAGNSTTSFTWTCAAIANSAIALSAAVSGTDAVDGSVRSANAGATVAISDAVQIASAPLGATTRFAYVFEFNGRVYLGPSQDGTGGVRMMPDGSNAEPFSLTFNADSVNKDSNGAAKGGNFPSLGFTGCAAGTLSCGPDNENGRGLFGSGGIGGVPWLVASGARTADKLRHVYATSDTGTAPAFSYAYIANAMTGETRGTSSMLVFHDRLYLGFPDTGGNRPTYVVLRKTPPAPGFSPATGTDVVNLSVNVISGFGAAAKPTSNPASMQMIDSQTAFNDLLYA
ncbi:MAG TPA: hypothetical protein VG496_12445, partial [Myxococcales bacterium]|nr:hypothetical protein [Myxococcales bacterium]